MFVLKSIIVTSLLAVVLGADTKPDKGLPESNYTITERAWITVEVKNFDDEGEDLRGEIEIGLFGKTVPMTVLNFASICTGTKSGAQKRKLHYKNSYCHRLVQDMLIQCGDITTGDGSGTMSIYGDKFNDENFVLSHGSSGIISMANQGTDTNGSQFFILFGRARYLDGRHVAFGKVLKGMDVLESLNEMGPSRDYRGEKTSRPKHAVKIVDCRTEKVAQPYNLTKKTMKNNDPNNELPKL